MEDRVTKEVKHEQEFIEAFFCRTPGFFVEVGANAPTSIGSQTWHLEQSGWTGILIEPISDLYNEIVNKRPNSKAYKAACSSPDKCGFWEIKIPIIEGQEQTALASLEVNIDHAGFDNYKTEKVKVTTLDSILENENTKAVDFISIDVEGTELDVLKGFNMKKYRPKLILIEDRLVFLNKHLYLKKNGYKLVKRTGFNNWYIQKDSTALTPKYQDKLKLFKKLYLGLFPRKIKECLKMRSLKPLKCI